MTSESLSPESLYHYYRKNRPASANTPDDNRAAAVRLARDIPESLANRVYQSYRYSRNSDQDSSIDEIMAFINAAKSSDFVSVDVDVDVDVELPGSIPGLAPIADSKSNKAWLFGARSCQGVWRQAQKAVLTASRWRLTAPAVAALVLAILMIPKLFIGDQQQPGLPESIRSQAPVLATLLEQRHARSLGFASGLIDETIAFNRGLVATDITIAALSGSLSVLESTRLSVAAVADADELSGYDNIVAIRHNSLANAGGLVVDTPVAAEPSRELLKELAGMQSQLRVNSGNTESRSWFELGISIQAIWLTAQLHQEMDHPEPLLDSLLIFRNADIPKKQLPAGKLITELRSLAHQASLSDIDISRIVALSRDIKVLMN